MNGQVRVTFLGVNSIVALVQGSFNTSVHVFQILSLAWLGGCSTLETKYLTATATAPSGASQLMGYGADAAGLLGLGWLDGLVQVGSVSPGHGGGLSQHRVALVPAFQYLDQLECLDDSGDLISVGCRSSRVESSPGAGHMPR